MSGSSAEFKEAVHRLFNSTALGSGIALGASVTLPLVFNSTAVGTASLTGMATSLLLGAASLAVGQSVWGNPNELSEKSTKLITRTGLAAGIALPALAAGASVCYFTP